MNTRDGRAAEITLHGYFRSSAAYRVRIALNLKGLRWSHLGVGLLRGEQRSEAYLRLNPQGLVPALQHDDFILTQSLAILEYLEDQYPLPALLPSHAQTRARARQLAATIACDIHPLNNLRVLRYLTNALDFDGSAKQAWIQHWINEGFSALETELIRERTGPFCLGHTPTIADCCLVPQVFNAKRFGLDLASYPQIAQIAEHCETLEAFQRAHPSRQPDAV